MMHHHILEHAEARDDDDARRPLTLVDDLGRAAGDRFTLATYRSTACG